MKQRIGLHPWIIIFLAAFCMMWIVPGLFARERDIAKTNIPLGRSEENHLQGPYCGIYCVLGALHSLGMKASFADLAQPEYVGSPLGSNMAELVKALQDHGAHTLPLKGLTLSGLVALETPCILHVRRDGTAESHAHWVLFLGIRDGQALLLNPPNGEETLPLVELLYLWDGKGVAVFSENKVKIATMKVRILQFLDSAQMIGISFLACLGGFVVWPMKSPARFLGFGLRLILATGVCVVCQCFLSSSSIAEQWRLYASITRVEEKPVFATISAPELLQRLQDPNLTLVDARLGDNFQNARLPRAISLPIDCGPGLVNAVARQIGTRETVVYCQSESCTWSQAIARSLSLRGVGPIHIYKGGFQEWKEMKHPLERP